MIWLVLVCFVVDAMDISDQHNLDVVHNIFKTRLQKRGLKPIEASTSERQELRRDEVIVNVTEDVPQNYCGSCYGAGQEGECCNTCESVREVYRKKGWGFSNPSKIEQCVREGFEDKIKSQKDEACRMYGYLLVNKVAGNFHFAPGKSFQQNQQHVHDMEVYKVGSAFNLSHHINRLSFGTEFPGVINPLDDAQKIWNKPGSSEYQYFVKVVPTVYQDTRKDTINTNQYSVTEYEKTVVNEKAQGLPGVFFVYDISPIKVVFKETQRSLSQFLIGGCAIVGGIFTVSGIIDSLLYFGIKRIGRKSQ